MSDEPRELHIVLTDVGPSGIKIASNLAPEEMSRILADPDGATPAELLCAAFLSEALQHLVDVEQSPPAEGLH